MMKLQTSWINEFYRRKLIFDALAQALVDRSGIKYRTTAVGTGDHLAFLNESYGTLFEVYFTPEMDELFVPLLQAIIKQIEEYDEQTITS